MAILKGSCLCGAVTYKYEGPTGNLVHCHCSECRKWHGSAFRSRMAIKSENYEWVAGEDNVAEYQSSPNIIKIFCKICGSNLVTIYPNKEGTLGLPISGAEGDFGEYKEFHIFVGSKAKWYKISDDLPQYEGFPEDIGLIHDIYE